MIIQSLMFYVFSAVAVAGAMMVISSRNPVHSVLFLILTFFSSAGLFVLLGAEFLAMVLVVVYVGAVAVLFLFVVMMLDLNFVSLREGFLQYLPTGALVGLVLLVELGMIAGHWVQAPAAEGLRAVPTPALSQLTNTESLGMVLYTHYLYLFEGAGVVLLVAMIGAILLTHRRRPGVRRQNIAEQLARRKQDTLEIRKVPTGGGV
ncbi:MAG: NADH-quinone oxidoreductase subunit J [Alphaproteobacteria bacterium]